MKTILITVDALRADHLGQYGYERETMPVVDRLSEDGTIFKHAFANAPYTRISIPALHSSVRLAHNDLSTVSTVSEKLAQAGVATAAIGTRTGFKSAEGALAFETYITLGRDEYHAESPDQAGPLHHLINVGETIVESYPRLYHLASRTYHALPVLRRHGFEYKGYTSAEEVTNTAAEWISSHTDEDFFLWIHYMEGHRPYGVHDETPEYTSSVSNGEIRELMKQAGTAPESVTSKQRARLINLYDSDLRYCSDHMERLIDTIQAAGIWDETNIIFTADHGEEFYDHGKYFHRNLPYDELLHVPLIVRDVTTERPENVIDQRELIDLPPTVLGIHGVTPPSTFEGKHLFSDVERQVIATGTQQRQSPVVAGRWGGYKYIYTPAREYLFDLTADPAESHNLAKERPGLCETYREAIPRTYFTEAASEQLREPEDTIDRKQLEALGYLETKD